jgi:cell wall-active antibiotic response 4TMS protein YvqF
MTPARFRWGLMLITIGVLLLLNNADQLSWDYWWDLLQWWPVILIAIGLEKIFLHSKLSLISYLAPFLMVGTMVYVAFDTGYEYSRSSFFSSYQWDEEIGDSVTRTVAVLNHDESDLYVKAVNNDEISVRINRFTRKPKIEYSESDGIASLDVAGRIHRRGESLILSRRHYSRNWNVSFVRDIPLDITCRGEDSDITLNLKQIPAENIRIDNDDGDIDIRLGGLSEEIHIEIKGDDARLRLSVPEMCGLKITEADFAGYFQTMGMISEGGYYVTDGFDSAGVRVTMDIDADLRHLSISHR